MYYTSFLLICKYICLFFIDQIINLGIDYLYENRIIILEGNFLSYTLIKMCFADEMNAVMGCGKHGGTQRWQLTIIHLASVKESCITKET